MAGPPGANSPPPQRRSSVGVTDPDLSTALESHFGHPAFRPGQADAVGAAIAGRDVLLVMPTGAGKSVCYQLPALVGEGLAVVVSPLVSLMQDQVDSLGGRAALINAQRDPAENRRALERAMAGEVRMLYVAPERFATPGFVDRLRPAEIGLFVVDEAHCVSQWGHDFRPEYFRLGEVARALGARSLFAATATATPQVASDVVRRLGLRDPVRITTGFDRPNLSYDVRRDRLRAGQARGDASAAQRAGSAAGDRLRGDAQEDRRDRLAPRARARRARSRLPRRHGPRAAGGGPAGVHVRGDAGGRGNERIRDGRRQGRRAHRDPRDGAVVAGGLLPGGRARGTRRSALALRAARREPRQGAARLLHQPARRRRGEAPPLAPVPRGVGVRGGRHLPPHRDPAGTSGTARSPWPRAGAVTFARIREAGPRSSAVGLAAERRAPSAERGTVEQAIVRVVREAEPSIGRTRAVEILRGGRSKVVRKYGYDELPGYGSFDDWRADDLLREVDALIDGGMLRSTGGRFPKLKVAA